jgi:hypothetical protein
LDVTRQENRCLPDCGILCDAYNDLASVRSSSEDDITRLRAFLRAYP